MTALLSWCNFFSLRSVRMASSVVLLTAVMSVSSHIKFYLPISPVPVTLQTLCLFLSSAILGRWTWTMVTVWFFMGVSGLPVFAGGASLSYLLGPTGGYLMGFVLVGIYFSCVRFPSSLTLSFLYFLCAQIILYSSGCFWLAFCLKTNIQQAAVLGLFPFVAKAILEVSFASLILRFIRKE